MKKTILYIAYLLILSLNVIGQNSYQELIALGNKNIQAKDYKAAIANFEKALVEQPNDTAAYFGVIRACLFANDLRAAEKYINKAISVYPNNAELILRRGILNNLKGDFDRGAEDFDVALSLRPSKEIEYQLLLNRGASHIRLENYQPALDDYNRALEISPRNPSIYNYMGLANYKLGNYLDAIANYSNAIDLDPNNSSSYYNRGMAYLKNSEKQKACMDFHKSCNLKNINGCKMIMAECAGK
jgi:tetratricopeptide (TPR) repeat protein